MVDDDLPPLMIEPVPIIPVFCSGVGYAVEIDGNAHLAFYVEQPAFGRRTKGNDRIINARIVMTLRGLAEATEMVKAKLGPKLRRRGRERNGDGK